MPIKSQTNQLPIGKWTFVKRDKLCFHFQFNIDYISREQYIVIFSK